MNQVFSTQEYSEYYPINLLTDLVDKQANGCLTLVYQSINYFIYLKEGKIVYATNSLEPFERIERHLRLLSHQVSKINSEVRTYIRLTLKENTKNSLEKPQDYQAITWLCEENYLSQEQASILISNIVNEIFETFLLLPKSCQGSFNENIQLDSQTDFLELHILVDKSLKSLQDWSSLTPCITSSYQRAYFANKSQGELEHKKLSKIVRGLNFRQLAAVLNQREISLVQKLYPLILNKTIILKEPQSPFDLLPNFSPEFISNLNQITQVNTDILKDTRHTKTEDKEWQRKLDIYNKNGENIAEKTNQKKWKIVCIDDSPAILQEISRFLDRDEFTVFPISESLKALVKIIRIAPDLILLDIGMPNIDGYKLCSLIRKYSAFKDTPIVMVSGNKGLIDRAKAKVSGATDYMTKPFTQSDLLDIVFRYLS